MKCNMLLKKFINGRHSFAGNERDFNISTGFLQHTASPVISVIDSSGTAMLFHKILSKIEKNLLRVFIWLRHMLVKQQALRPICQNCHMREVGNAVFPFLNRRRLVKGVQFQRYL